MMMHDEFDSPISTYDLWCHAPALVHLTTATGDLSMQSFSELSCIALPFIYFAFSPDAIKRPVI